MLLSGDAGVGKTRLLTELRDLAFTEGWQVVRRPLPRLRRQRAALPPVLRGPRPDRGRPARRPSTRSPRAHPALARLQPGRRVIGAPRSADDEPRARPRRPVRGRARPPRGRRGPGAAAARRRGHPLGRPVDPRHAQLPLLPPVRGPGGDGRVLPLRRPAPPPPAPPPGRRVVATARRAPGGPAAAARGRGARPHRRAGARRPRRGRARRHRRRAPRATRSSSRSSPAPPPARAGGCRPTSPTCSSCASTGSTTPRGQAVRAASASGRRVAHDMLAAASGLDAAQLDEGLRKAVEMNVLVAGDGRYSFRHALLGEAVYDDLLPGERVRLHGAYSAALQAGAASGTAAELARHARLAMDLDTALTASIQAGNEASQVGGPDEAAYHYQQALELLVDPRRCAEVDIDLSKLVVSAAEALSASGDPERAAEGDRRAARPAAGRGADELAGPDAVHPGEPDAAHRGQRPDPGLERRGGAGARGRQRAARPGPGQPRARARPEGPLRGGPGRGHGGALAGRAARPQRARLRRHHDPVRAEEGRPEGGPARRPARRGRPRPASRARSRRSCGPATCSAGPTRTGRSSRRPSTGSAAPSTSAWRPAPRSRRTRSRRAGSWRGCTTCSAGGTTRWR